jgi:hypothetical protein
MAVRRDKVWGITVGINKNERVVLWEDNTMERFSHAEFAKLFG